MTLDQQAIAQALEARTNFKSLVEEVLERTVAYPLAPRTKLRRGAVHRVIARYIGIDVTTLLAQVTRECITAKGGKAVFNEGIRYYTGINWKY